MAIKVQFLVTGSGQLNGNLRVSIDTVMDQDLADRLRVDKNSLLSYVNTQYPGAKISPTSLTVRILPIKNTPVPEQTKPKEKKEKPKTKTSQPPVEKDSFGSLLVSAGKQIVDDYKAEKDRAIQDKVFFESKMSELLNTPIPNEIQEINYFISDLSLKIKTYGWATKATNKNRYSDLCFEKIKMAVERLKYINPQIDILPYEKKIKRIKWTRILKKIFYNQ